MKKVQQLSTSMKTLLAVGGISVLAGSGVMVANAMEADSSINASKAKDIALKDAGVEATLAKFEKAALEKEDGQNVYEVKFRTSEHTYEYTIASKDGDIIDRDVESLKKTASSQGSSINLDNAKKTLLKDAGLKESDGTFIKMTSEKEDGQDVYEIEFKTATKTYDYKIAKDGRILEKDVESNKGTSDKKTDSSKTNNATNSNSSNSSNNSNTASSQGMISKTTARNKALADAGVKASNATFTKTQLDYENGRPVYDIEFVTSTTEYDYEIDAKTGNVRERSSERLENHNQDQSKPSSSYIGVDRAKSTALKHAGLSSSQVTFTKAKLDNDDGRYVYEIEFRKGNMEYEYTIDARKGTILEWDKDLDND